MCSIEECQEIASRLRKIKEANQNNTAFQNLKIAKAAGVTPVLLHNLIMGCQKKMSLENFSKMTAWLNKVDG
jgi:hypothetical protein